MRNTIRGRRREINRLGFYEHHPHAGEYGKIERTLEQVHGIEKQLWWTVFAPDGSSCALDPSVHTVTEHEDGTISVHPSIVTKTWHGWLENGNWRSIVGSE